MNAKFLKLRRYIKLVQRCVLEHISIIVHTPLTTYRELGISLFIIIAVAGSIITFDRKEKEQISEKEQRTLVLHTMWILNSRNPYISIQTQTSQFFPGKKKERQLCDKEASEPGTNKSGQSVIKRINSSDESSEKIRLLYMRLSRHCRELFWCFSEKISKLLLKHEDKSPCFTQRNKCNNKEDKRKCFRQFYRQLHHSWFLER